MSRRLPVYLVLDCSESMAGDAIKAVEDGVGMMISQLRSDPYALETVWISVITFNYQARVHVPLTDITGFMLPRLVLGSGTALGAAISLLDQRIKADVVKTTPERKGDWKPVIFILTDGEPTDDWQGKADRFKRDYTDRGANVVALACGEDASTRNLRRLTDQVILARDMDPGTLKGLFRWVSASVASASQAVDQDRKISLEKTDRLAVATSADDARSVDPDRQLFLQSRCVKDRSHYIMRFRRDAGASEGRYKAVASHPVADFDDTAAKDSVGLRVATDRLEGSPPCPKCSSPLWAMCQCGRVHCCPELEGETVTLTCPWCGQTGDYAPQSFEVGRGFG